MPWKRLTLQIETRLDAVPVLGQVVSLLCAAAGFAPVEASQLEVCVVEAINNSILHACRQDPIHSVELEASLLPGELIFDVWDSGTPAEEDKINADHAAALEARSELTQEISESGRGLAIIQETMDIFEYTPGTGRNRFRMIKRREPEGVTT